MKKNPKKQTKQNPDETLLYRKTTLHIYIHMGSILVHCIVKLFNIKTKTKVGLHYLVILCMYLE